jgi:hypothetical protein
MNYKTLIKMSERITHIRNGKILLVSFSFRKTKNKLILKEYSRAQDLTSEKEADEVLTGAVVSLVVA